MTNYSAKLIIALSGLLFVGGCIGTRGFPVVARGGDTVAIAAGWKQHFQRTNTTVTILPAVGFPIIYPPNHPAIRAIVNLYPDPVSSVLVSMATQQDLTPYAGIYGSLVNSNFTNGDNDWWETTVFIDLPATLPIGTTTIYASNPLGESATSTVDVVSGTGTPTLFETTFGPLQNAQLYSLERVGHHTVKFSGSAVPYAIQIDLSHSPDVDHGGAGRAHVINTRGDIKNVAWSDTGSSLKVILTPARGQALTSLLDYKFYIAGGIAGLYVTSVKAYDINGNPVTGVTAALSN
ncbi:MAG: hypothetical protein A2V58_06185 [Candidatus Muproteobacteria bacterium RBG_19FT_COMBO_61_10]|uniref:Uncharacterized protein n=1 Tax=Candidatus Muproteobacteria bacterium RBG_19FT_COMBO_61_10 TaxID=1817761 RepID=A0A1F6UPC0_9PROT|nr:MAG: hypothetical protein A2V58_06185 [Candidatus Muproteobacteria bacterium RBG_19FT_COMBO_61_10]